MYKKIALLCCVLFILVACGKKEVKPVSQESKTALAAFHLADRIRQDFIDRDFEALRRNSTEKGYQDITEGNVSFDSLELTFTPRWVEIDKDKVLVNISWTGSWVVGEKKKEDRGMAVFVMEGVPLKVAGIKRANPFVYPTE
ncbi:MAG: hypothetical protein P8013_09665 [Candidatus Sulfobium sp.]|jgi:hypothetical protein